ncbi:MAG: hypothetical protein WC026_16930 [Hyphomicrobium sp.]|uniref:hypothetical protein n=1 Tax=Hyphomicrobium sp. TaxID=82 RepID=UPI003566B20D
MQQFLPHRRKDHIEREQGDRRCRQRIGIGHDPYRRFSFYKIDFHAAGPVNNEPFLASAGEDPAWDGNACPKRPFMNQASLRRAVQLARRSKLQCELCERRSILTKLFKNRCDEAIKTLVHKIHLHRSIGKPKPSFQ